MKVVNIVLLFMLIAEIIFTLLFAFCYYSRQSVFLMATAKSMQTLEGFVHIVG